MDATKDKIISQSISLLGTREEIERIKRAFDLNKDILEMRALIFKAFAYDPEVRAKIIEYIKKNESRTN